MNNDLNGSPFLLSDDNGNIIASEMTLNISSYTIEGLAVIIHWCEGTGIVKMNPFNISAKGIESEDSLKEMIRTLLNDGGFGCRGIKGAYVKIFANYKNDLTSSKVFVKDAFINNDPYKLSDEEIDFMLTNDVWI